MKTNDSAFATLRSRLAIADSPSKRVALWALIAAIVWIVAGLVLPEGLPLGVVILGLVFGSLHGMTALGLVLVYRATRVVNFAQAEIGGLASAVAVLMVTGHGLPYLLAVPLGLAAAALTGLVVDTVVVKRFERSPRLIFTVATIGVAQIVGAAQLGLPSLFGNLRPLSVFTTPFELSITVGPILFTGDHVLALAVALIATLGLGWFLSGTDAGVAIRGVSDSVERAMLLGVPVRSLSRLTWVVAAVLSGVGVLLATPIKGVNVGVIAGASSLLPALTAAVLGRMHHLGRTMAAALLLGVFQQAIFWSFPRTTVVDVAQMVIVLGALLLQRSSFSRGGRLDGESLVRLVRPVPVAIGQLVEFRVARVGLSIVAAALALIVPLALSDANVSLLANIAIYAIVAVALVILVGWSGQVSLGQFAFVGIGAGVTGGLIVNGGTDLFVALIAGAIISAIAAVLVGLPALRIPGLFLAVATLAFAVPVSSFLLSSTYFPSLTPAQIQRPELLGGRISLESEYSFYLLCLAILVVVLLGARNLRTSRTGRVLVAVNDNERAAQGFSISPVRTKLFAFGLAGAIAGLAGGLWAVGVRGIGFGAFNPEQSLQVFTMVVVGGLGSLSGAILGAIYVQLAMYFLDGAMQLLATGAGLLVLLMAIPGGLGEVLYRVRDRFVAALARARQIESPGFLATLELPDALVDQPASVDLVGAEGESVRKSVSGATAANGHGGDEALLSWDALDARYGQVQILFGVSGEIAHGEILGLLGTNGAGKSTLLRVLAGLLPTSGSVRLQGREVSDLDPQARVRSGLVLVPGGRGVFHSLTVDENLRVAGWTLRSEPAARTRWVNEALDLFPSLRTRRSTLAGSLSGGEQQMLAIAQAIMCRPQVLFIDELSLGLSPVVVGELLGAVRRLNAQGVTVIIVEQSLNVATSIAPRAMFLERGIVRFSGPTAELADRGDLARAVFLGSVKGSLRKRPATKRSPKPAADEIQRPGLSVKGVSVHYGGVHALRDVSIEVASGEIVGVIGSNGAGKTTLLDVCSGYLDSSGGTIGLIGSDVTGETPEDRARLGLGRVFQDARLFPSLTVRETVAVAFERFVDVREPIAGMFRLHAAVESERSVMKAVDELLDRLDLRRYETSFIAELSTGTRRIVELACTLAHSPTVLLLDEPTSGLAQRESEALADLLVQLRDDTAMTMLVVEHDIPVVSSISDRLVCMHMGEVIAQGVPSKVLGDKAVVASYLGEDDAAIGRSSTARPKRRRRAEPLVSGTGSVRAR